MCSNKFPVTEAFIVSNATVVIWFCFYENIRVEPALNFFNITTKYGFGGLEVPKFAGSNPAEAVGFLGRKNPQHAFLRRGSKAVGPMS